MNQTTSALKLEEVEPYPKGDENDGERDLEKKYGLFIDNVVRFLGAQYSAAVKGDKDAGS